MSWNLLKNGGLDIEYTSLGPRSREEIVKYDFVVANKDVIVVVETGSTLLLEDIDRFIEKLKKFTNCFSLYAGQIIYGCMTFTTLGEGAANYAEKCGLFLIKFPEGESEDAMIKNSIDFKPKAL